MGFEPILLHPATALSLSRRLVVDVVVVVVVIMVVLLVICFSSLLPQLLLTRLGLSSSSSFLLLFLFLPFEFYLPKHRRQQGGTLIKLNFPPREKRRTFCRKRSATSLQVETAETGSRRRH